VDDTRSCHGDGFDAIEYGIELDLDDRTTVSAVSKTLGHSEALLV